jgi:hypothetical protein
MTSRNLKAAIKISEISGSHDGEYKDAAFWVVAP